MGSKIIKLTQTPKLRVAKVKGFTVFYSAIVFSWECQHSQLPGKINLRNNLLYVEWDIEVKLRSHM